MAYIYLGKYRSSPCVFRTLWLDQRRSLRSRPKRSRMNAFRVWQLGLYRCYTLEFSPLRFADIVNRPEAGERLDYDRILAPNNGDDESWIQQLAAPERLKRHCSFNTEFEVSRHVLYLLPSRGHLRNSRSSIFEETSGVPKWVIKFYLIERQQPGRSGPMTFSRVAWLCVAALYAGCIITEIHQSLCNVM